MTRLEHCHRGACALASLVLLALSETPADAAILSRPGRLDQSEYAVAYQINPAHSGSIDFKTGFGVPLARVWKTRITKGSPVSLSYPLIAENKVFFTAIFDVGKADDGVYALDLATGSSIWTDKFDIGTFLVEPAYDNGMIFTQTGGGLLEALSAKSGKLKWSLQIGTGAFSPLTAVNGLVHPDEGYVAVDEATGNIVWYGQYVNSGGEGTVAMGDGGVYVVGTCNYYKLDAATGIADWNTITCQQDGGYILTPTYYSNRVFVEDSEAGNVVLEAKNGKNIGTFPGTVLTPPAFQTVKKQKMGFSISGNTLTAWNVETGATVWSFTDGNSLLTPPIAVNGLVFLAGFYTLYALDAQTGAVKWSDDSAGGILSLAAGQGKLVAIARNVDGTFSVTAYAPQ